MGWANSYYMEAGSYIDEWVIGFKPCEYTTRYGKGSYTEISSHPLAEMRLWKATLPPNPNRSELYQDAARTIQGVPGRILDCRCDR